MNTENRRICSECAKEPALKELIGEQGNRGKLCSLCKRRRQVTVDVANPLVVQLVRALVRYYYSEHKYNSHFGGVDIRSLLSDENPILRHSTDRLMMEDIGCIIFANGYEPYDKGISMYGDLLCALKDDVSPVIKKLRGQLSSRNYFDVEADMASELEVFKGKIDHVLPAGMRFYRARIGYVAKAIPLFVDMDVEYLHVPFSASTIGAPPPNTTTAARINRQGVAFLYLASDIATAVAEVRPHPGHHVSVGAFETSVELRLADFRAINIRHYCASDKKLDEFMLLNNINNELSSPITPEEKDRYVVGQFVADVMRKWGYHGVLYRSSVASGYNVCIFSPQNCGYVEGEAAVLEIKSLQYTTVCKTTVVHLPEGAVIV